MHEVALAQSVWRQVAAEMQRHPDGRLRAVHLRVGRWSGADPESLEFALRLLAGESPWPDTAIRIVTEPLGLRCRACAAEFEPAELNLRCPACGSGDTEVVRGKDLYIDALEVEENDGEAQKGCET